MMPIRKYLLTGIFISVCTFAGAQESASGDFQINSVILVSSYPVYNSGGGRDTLRYASAGIGIKSTKGKRLKGMIELAVLFPYVYEASLYPQLTFVALSKEQKPFSIDGVLGVSYAFDFRYIFLNVGAGVHVNTFFDNPDYLFSIGLSADTQGVIPLGRIITAQLGLRFNVDFFGTQTFFGTSRNYAGLPIGFAFYTGFGFHL